MESYILLLTLTAAGREAMLEDPDFVLRASEEVEMDEIQVLGLYGVLGEYDFVNIIRAADNDAAARLSLELGVRAKVHVVTMPAIPISRLSFSDEDEENQEPTSAETEPSTDENETGRNGDGVARTR